MRPILQEFNAQLEPPQSQSVDDEHRRRIKDYLDASHEAEDSFYMVDLGAPIKQMARWKTQLPRVKPFYAVKCNGNAALLRMLEAMDCGFDCASTQEFNTILAMGVDPSRIIFANPCKQVSHVKAARAAKLSLVTFDNEAELDKIAAHWPEAELLLRIVTDDSASVCEFSTKFGASLKIVPALIRKCKKLNLNLVGVSFHVGSGCGDANAFVKSAMDARWVFDEAASQGIHMTLLDIGGGFPGDALSTPTFEDIASALRPYLDEYFPDTRLIAEPGRFFACSTHTLVCNVFSKRLIDIPEEDKKHCGDHIVRPTKPSGSSGSVEYQYYINDGVYQSFNCLFFDHVHIGPEHVKLLDARPANADRHISTIFGPTCDALDCILKRAKLPEIQTGEWIFFTDFGAYTVAAASKFNGFGTAKYHYTCSVDLASSDCPANEPKRRKLA